ncbi:MAG: rod-binding protein [Thermoguttaceae bacterium]|nr:rod-binding protein [Thermoguttaceae bacterium]MDW8038923.1 rod-binding protein [Thermoguttaceae bacterium]
MNSILAAGNPMALSAGSLPVASPVQTPRLAKTGPSEHAEQSCSELRKAFDAFLGEVYFGQMLKAMRRTTGKPAYVYGGIAEDIFTQQLDQILAESLTKTLAHKVSEPMFELFMLSRR